jgi:hypothetical protein
MTIRFGAGPTVSWKNAATPAGIHCPLLPSRRAAFSPSIFYMGDDIMMRAARLIRRGALVLLLVISSTIPTLARAKTDVVILKNGDHLTCEIKNLTRGELTVKTDSAGTLEIKWGDVEGITSKYLFTIQDIQGRIYVGSLQPSADKQHTDVVGPQAASNLDNMSIVLIQELGRNRWMRFSGSADLSYAFTKASDITQFNFSGDLTYRTEKYAAQTSYSSTFGTSSGETDADRKLLNIAGTREFPGKWLAYAQVGLEHNLELELDRRYTVLAGPGYRIKQSNRAMVTAIAAASFSRESYYGQDLSKNIEGFYMIDAQFFKLYSPKFDIINQFAYLPNYSNWGRRRLEYNSKIRIEVLKDFYVTLTFYDSYDSKPPSKTAAKNDYGFTTGLSWTFRR